VSGTRVTASGARSGAAAAAPPVAAGRRWRWSAVTVVIVVATVIAAGLRLYQLSRPGYLLGITEYDDGTDFGSAVRLVHGALPYRDFIMVQPPGITLIMAPVALVTRGLGTVTGMAVARVLTALASTAAVPLAGLLTRHRGLLAVVVSCGMLTVFPDSIMAARTVLLEPWLVLFCMLGALAAFDGDRMTGGWRLFAGGALFGFAGAVKVWAVIPVAVILLLNVRQPRRAAVFAGGAAAGFLGPVLPFALTAPVTFYRSVFVAQLVRTDLTRIPLNYRLQNILGLNHASQMADSTLITISIVVLVVLAAITVIGSRLLHRPPPALDWFAFGTCLLVVAAFLWPVDFYYHYPGFLAPFLALTVALPLSRLAAGLAAGERRTWARLVQPGAAVLAGGVLLTLVGFQAASESNYASAVLASEISAAQRMIPSGACVVTDQVSYTLAINRFVSDVPGCSLMVDGVGTDYALSGKNGQNGAGSVPALQAIWMSAFRHAQYVWLTTQATRRIPFTHQLQAYLDTHFVPLTEGPDWLFVRKV